MKIKYHLILFFLLPVFFFSCEKKDKADDMKRSIVGVWQLTLTATFDETITYPDIIRFQENYVFQSYNTTTDKKVRGGWSYEKEMLTISVYLPAAFYIQRVDAQNLTLRRMDFNSEGELVPTTLTYRRTTDFDSIMN